MSPYEKPIGGDMALRALGSQCSRAFAWDSMRMAPSRGRDLSHIVGSSIRSTGAMWQQSRTLATRIEEPLPGDSFFNREREVNAVRGVLRSPPQLSVFTGPVNSGKTSLLLKNLKEEADSGRAVLHLDLRDRGFRTVEGFVPAMEKEFTSWRDRLLSVAKGMKVDLEGYGIKADIALGSNQPRAIDRLDTLFDKMGEQLPPGNIWKGRKTPILFIDEANKLKTLLDDPDGHGALISFFEWMVKNTKQISRFHIVLASSDSFFHLWLNRYIGKPFFQSYVIGDLPKDEAKRFWEERVVTGLSLPDGLNPPSFGEAYDVCGGNLFFLRNYLKEFAITHIAGMEFTPDDFQFVRNEWRRLTDALRPDELSEPNILWTREQFIELMTDLTTSGQGFLLYSTLENKWGKKVVDSLIAYNVLHLRPGRNFAFDIDPPRRGSVVTAESPAAHYAMRVLLENLDEELSAV
jgi:hypothetical protein